MSDRLTATLSKAAVTSVMVVMWSAPLAVAQAPGYSPPKTSWGAPDLGGFWTNESYTVMSRPSTTTKLTVTEEEEKLLIEKNIYTKVTADEAGASDVSEEASRKLLADNNPNRGYNRYWFEPGAHFARVKGEIRTSWVVEPADGKVPYSNDFALGRNFGNDYTSYETRPLEERCLRGFTNGAGPVIGNGMYNNNYQIVQTPTSALIFAEMIHDARIIPIVASKADARHGPDVIKKWTGDSVGWYEGNTLVIETTNIHPKQRGYASEKGKVTERFTRWDDGQLLYEFSVDDPAMYTQPWKGEMSFNVSQKPTYEYACHEGNHGLYGILAGARQFEAEGIPQQVFKPTFGDLQQN
jgi:hypothetical protein